MIAACLTAAASLPAFLCSPDVEPPPPPPPAVVLTPERPYGPIVLPAPVPEPEPYEVPEPWYSLAVCESGMNGVPRWDVDTGNGFRGGLQFWPPTWRAFGGEEFAAQANHATPAEQVEVAERVLAEQGWGAWPACSKKIGLR